MSLFGADDVRQHLLNSTETLEEARALFSSGFTRGVVNRIYYACFYAVSALLETEGMASSKHSGVLSLFNKHWVRTGRMPKELGRFYIIAFDERQEGDYTALRVFDRDHIKAWLSDAEIFVDTIRTWIRDNKGIELD